MKFPVKLHSRVRLSLMKNSLKRLERVEISSNPLICRLLHSSRNPLSCKREEEERAEDTKPETIDYASRRRILSPTRRLASMLPNSIFKDPESLDPSSPQKLTPDQAKDDVPVGNTAKFNIKSGSAMKRLGRSLLPATRLASLLPPNFWSVQDDHVKSAVEDVRKTADALDGVSDTSNPLRSDTAKSHALNTSADKKGLGFSYGEIFLARHPENRSVGQKELQNLRVLKEGVILRGNNVEDLIADKVPPLIIRIPNSKNKSLIMRPNLGEFCAAMSRKVFIAHPEVINNVLFYLNIKPTDSIFECGSGSAGNTLHMSKAVWDSGKVYSIDKDTRRAVQTYQLWRENHDRVNSNPWPDNVTFNDTPMQLFSSSDIYDKIYLDAAGSVRLLERADALLKVGGLLAFYSPSVNKIMEAMKYIKEKQLNWIMEGMFEDSHVHWQFCRLYPSFSLELSLRSEMDHTIAYVAIFRKMASPEESPAVVGEPFGENLALITSTRSRKKGYHIYLLTDLKTEKHVATTNGKCASSEIASRPEGFLHQTSCGSEIYASRPTLCDVLNRVKNTCSFRTKSLNQLCTSLDVSRGSTVLEITKHPGRLTAMLSAAVGIEGRVDSLTINPGLNQRLFEFANRYNFITDNYAVIPQTSEDTLADLPNDRIYDQVCITSRAAKLLRPLCDKISPGTRVGILFPGGVEGVQEVLNEIKTQNLPYFVLGVSECNHRPWLLQESVIHQNYDGSTKFMCRPKQKVYERTEFLMTLVYGCRNKDAMR